MISGNWLVGSAVSLSSDSTALASADTMTPPSTRVMTLKPPVRARAMDVVNSTVTSPAASAIACTPSRFPSSSSAATAPTQVPAATPRVSGVARGLENRDWNEAPATDSPAPISTATMTRGTRRLKTTESMRGATAGPAPRRARKAATMSASETS